MDCGSVSYRLMGSYDYYPLDVWVIIKKPRGIVLRLPQFLPPIPYSRLADLTGIFHAASDVFCHVISPEVQTSPGRPKPLISLLPRFLAKIPEKFQWWGRRASPSTDDGPRRREKISACR